MIRPGLVRTTRRPSADGEYSYTSLNVATVCPLGLTIWRVGRPFQAEDCRAKWRPPGSQRAQPWPIPCVLKPPSPAARLAWADPPHSLTGASVNATRAPFGDQSVAV